MAILMVRPDKLRARLAEARTAWEELPTGPDWYTLRHRAEARYMSLFTLAKAAGVAQ